MRLVVSLLTAAVLAAPPVLADKRLDQAVKKAEGQLAKGKPQDAIKTLEKEVKRSPRDPEPALALASLHLRLGRPDEAGTMLAKAGELAGAAPPPLRARVRASQSAFALRAGTAADALSFAREAVEASAGPESLAALARAQARLGDTAAARETARRAAQAGPDSAAVQLARGDALHSARLDAEAEAAYRRALQLAPGSVAASTGLALALAGRGQARAAIEAAEAAFKQDPHAAEAQAALAVAHLADDPEDRKSDAMAAAYQAAMLEPKNPRVTLVLGRVHEARGQLDEATRAYAEAGELDPSWPAPRVAALSAELARGDADGALRGLLALPEPIRASGAGELLRGRILVQRDDWAEALAALDRAVAALPGLAEAHALRGAAAYGTGDLALAASSYGRAVELAPSNLDYARSHALQLAYDGRAEEAVAAMRKTMERPAAQTAEDFRQLGVLYRSFHPPRVAEAVAAYEQALKLDPKDPRAALDVAESYRDGQQWARAISAYERVSQSFPRLDGEATLGTAWCYHWSGDATRARFYTGLAVRGGADVREIRKVLGQPPGNAAITAPLAELRDQLRAKHKGEQARAVVGLLALGRAGVPSLAAALGREGTSLAVRERIVAGLGALGSDAREALVQLDRLAKAAPPSGGDAREAALVASAREASERIRAGRP